ncbi:MAG: hypothetical protein EOO77_05155 [Oxalobacteraceae bacterium]|nr:MAG: hypothetical protein EOO77_05155 [Oxalobacteraceae bacterium]
MLKPYGGVCHVLCCCVRTKNITITDIDTQEHQTPFDSSNKYTKVVERWQEMGVAIHGPPSGKDFTEAYAYIGARPENVNKGINMQYLPRADAKRLISKARKLRTSFMAAKQIKPDTIYSSIERNTAKNLSQDFARRPPL